MMKSKILLYIRQLSIMSVYLFSYTLLYPKAIAQENKLLKLFRISASSPEDSINIFLKAVNASKVEFNNDKESSYTKESRLLVILF